MKSLFAKKAKSAPELNEYSDSERTMSDEEAHRDRQYDLPTPFRQFVAVYQAQLKLIAKSKIIWLFFVAVAVIPLAVYSGILNGVSAWQAVRDGGPGDYMAGLLALLPIAISLLPSLLLSRSLPAEFKERTAFLNLALPQSRITFYLGKFCAGFTVVFFTLTFVYAVTGLMAIGARGDLGIGAIASSYAVALASSFAISGVAYCISTFLKRGAVILPFLLFFLILPGIVYGLLLTNYSNWSNMLQSIEAWTTWLPALGGELSSSLLGGPAFVFSFIGMVLYSNQAVMTVNLPLTLAIYVLWGVIALAIGLYRFQRREV